MRVVPFAVRLPVFGTVSTMAEVLNIHDNFGKGELRHDVIEHHLERLERPVVVDCGINVGVTVRWWHHLNGRVRVFGIEMMEEAHAFTRKRIGEPGDWYIPVTCALSSTDGQDLHISFDDPLHGENSVASTDRRHSRTVTTQTLDSCVETHGLDRVDVLKIDIEGHGAEALKGATRTLPKTRFVIFETHGRKEMSQASDILHHAGFELIAIRNRTLIYEKRSAGKHSLSLDMQPEQVE
jgi:FkbM family methyltransferase